jgi:hypothetical protein
MASEDSDQFISGFLMIHRLHDCRDFRQSLTGEVMADRAQIDAALELGEVISLARSQRISLEERNNDLAEIISPAHYEVPKIFFVVVMSSIDVDRSNSEEFAELVQSGQTSGALDHNKRMTHLPPGPITDPIGSAGLTSQTDREATFAVNETE